MHQQKKISQSEGYRIISDEAVVVSGRVKCWHCRTDIEVICLYCQTGFVDREAILGFSISNVIGVDDSLRRQLARWPNFRPTHGRRGDFDGFANHCHRCGKSQDDFYLHCQPGAVFFSFQHPASDALTIHVLQGPVRCSGDEGFEP